MTVPDELKEGCITALIIQVGQQQNPSGERTQD